MPPPIDEPRLIAQLLQWKVKEGEKEDILPAGTVSHSVKRQRLGGYSVFSWRTSVEEIPSGDFPDACVLPAHPHGENTADFRMLLKIG